MKLLFNPDARLLPEARFERLPTFIRFLVSPLSASVLIPSRRLGSCGTGPHCDPNLEAARGISAWTIDFDSDCLCYSLDRCDSFRQNSMSYSRMVGSRGSTREHSERRLAAPNMNQSMDMIQSARSFLDQQSDIAVWYTEYEGRSETIAYANGYFADIFGIPVDQILEKKRYHLVNPPDTPDEVIERYKDEDREAMKLGIFLTRGPFEASKDIVVVKLRFDKGMLGLFKIVDSQSDDSEIAVQDLELDFLNVLRLVRPDLLE